MKGKIVGVDTGSTGDMWATQNQAQVRLRRDPPLRGPEPGDARPRGRPHRRLHQRHPGAAVLHQGQAAATRWSSASRPASNTRSCSPRTRPLADRSTTSITTLKKEGYHRRPAREVVRRQARSRHDDASTARRTCPKRESHAGAGSRGPPIGALHGRGPTPSCQHRARVARARRMAIFDTFFNWTRLRRDAHRSCSGCRPRSCSASRHRDRAAAGLLLAALRPVRPVPHGWRSPTSTCSAPSRSSSCWSSSTTRCPSSASG